MSEKALLTTGEVVAHCRVSYETVHNWIRSGKLTTYTTPGKHHRIPVEEFKRFLAEYNLPPLEEEPAPRRKVLVVDDDPNIAEVIVRSLSHTHRYELACAADGFEAGLQVVKFRPDLIILDLMMPQLDGFKVCQKIRAAPETRDIRILVITGYATEENVQKVLEAGADCCLAKPFAMRTLKKLLQELEAGAHEMSRTG